MWITLPDGDLLNLDLFPRVTARSRGAEWHVVAIAPNGSEAELTLTLSEPDVRKALTRIAGLLGTQEKL